MGTELTIWSEDLRQSAEDEPRQPRTGSATLHIVKPVMGPAAEFSDGTVSSAARAAGEREDEPPTAEETLLLGILAGQLDAMEPNRAEAVFNRYWSGARDPEKA